MYTITANHDDSMATCLTQRVWPAKHISQVPTMLAMLTSKLWSEHRTRLLRPNASKLMILLDLHTFFSL